MACGEAAVLDVDFEKALREYATAVTLSGREPDGLAICADALRAAGIVRQSRAEWRAAERDFRDSHEAAARLDDASRVGRAENCLAAVAFEQGDWDDAERHYEKARALAESCGDAELAAQVENNMGTLLAARGDHVRAEAAFCSALERFEDLEHHPFAARALNNLGLALAKQGRHQQATLAYDRALQECKRRGDPLFASKVLINQARLELARESPIQAHAAATKAWTLARRLEDRSVAAGALCILGEVALALNDFVGAIYYLRRALKLAGNGKAPLVEAETWAQIGKLYEAKGETQRAIDTWQYARSCYRRLGARIDADRLGEQIDSTTRTHANG